MNTCFLLLAVSLLAQPTAPAEEFTIQAGTKESVNTVIRYQYTTQNAGQGSQPVLTIPGQKLLAQVSGTHVVAVIPKLAADQRISAQITWQPNPTGQAPTSFSFAEKPGQHIDILYGQKPVVRYVNTPRDKTSATTHELTFKPFHHIFDPVTGEVLLTNGPGLASNKDLLFPHHRGLFYAFNRISYGDEKNVDTWHGRKGEYVLHHKMMHTETGPLFASHTAHLTWHGRLGDVFADEVRTVTVHQIANGTMLDFSSTMTTSLPQVKLDGDPQHAGCQFRAAMEVAKNGKANTYYLRPDGKGKVGETRNWDPKTKLGSINLPWNAVSFVVSGQRYTVLRINHSSNPKDARGSERDYGRFGDYFEYTLTPEKPLRVQYRYWVQAGEMTVAECEAMSHGFDTSTKIMMK